MPSSRRFFAFLAVGFAAMSPAFRAGAQTLRGSLASVERQYSVAVRHDFSFLQTAGEVSKFVAQGLLVRINPTGNVQLAGVSYPYARPALKTFVQRLGSQYRSACGQPLVVTSLTRPANEQPRNASDESVHPAGMAVDLRIGTGECRKWLEKTLLSMEKRGLIDATKERRPAHFHVAVFPTAYMAYVDSLTGSGKKGAPSIADEADDAETTGGKEGKDGR